MKSINFYAMGILGEHPWYLIAGTYKHTSYLLLSYLLLGFPNPLLVYNQVQVKWRTT